SSSFSLYLSMGSLVYQPGKSVGSFFIHTPDIQ
ncbi:MAG: hypothetical protein ACI94D_001566, partial [Neolewinella sp.]